MKKKKSIRKVTNCIKSSTFVIILGILGFLFGINVGKNTGLNTENILINLSIVISLGLLMYIYLKANTINSLAKSINEKKLIKYLYFSLVLLFFIVYYLNNKDIFINTYELNKIGIDQIQYIFIVNFIGFFLISFVLYNLILKDYSIKKLSKNNIELSEELDVAGQQSKLINRYEEIIKTYSQVICNIDKKMDYLNSENLIRNDYEVDEYIIVIDEFVKDFILINKDISIIVKSIESFEEYACDELGCNSFNIKKIKLYIEKNRVYIHNNRIYIMYNSSIVNNDIVLIVDMDNVYPGELGLLIHSYLLSVETSYSKYLVDINGGVFNSGE